jgi:hypothetical protein
MASDSEPSTFFGGLSGVPWTFKNRAIRGPSLLLGGQPPVIRALVNLQLR